MKKFKKAATKSVKQIQKNIKKAYKKAKHTIVKKVNKIKKTIKRTAQSIKQIGTKALSKAKSKVKALGKATKAATHASKLVMAKAKKQKAAEKAARKAKAYQALCKDKTFVNSQNKGFSDPTYDSKAGYPKPGEVWAFDAKGNIDKKKSEELSKKLGDWSTAALMLVIPGPDELLLAGLVAKNIGLAGIKMIPKAISSIGKLWSKMKIGKGTKLIKGVKIEGRGTTGRTEAKNLIEQIGMKSAKQSPFDPGEGNTVRMIIDNLGDTRWKGWEKWEIVYRTKDGQKATIHFTYDPKNKLFDDFKFK
ncbi:hypothetical protein [Listeria booriae]|uniref:hypothetical protein n=1 Tax=Listeria booriae TaxID=1552123 RepID=UPI001625A6AC|nr:hypothetical protein [Listeria booriae]